MIQHTTLTDQAILTKIRHKELSLGGNKRLKIYGNLHCASGKRMKKENRVFFATEQEAIIEGYRPCGHCMPAAYQKYKLKAKSK